MADKTTPDPRSRDLPTGWQWDHNVWGNVVFSHSDGQISELNPWWALYETGADADELGPLPSGWDLVWQNNGRPFFTYESTNQKFLTDPRRFLRELKVLGIDTDLNPLSMRQHEYHRTAVGELVGPMPDWFDIDWTVEGSTFFIDHQLKSVSNEHPENPQTVDMKFFIDASGLKPFVTPAGIMYFLDEVTGVAEWLLPGEIDRLAQLIGPFQEGIELRMANNLRYVVVDHSTKTTIWPVSPLYDAAEPLVPNREDGLGPLPAGWFRMLRPEGFFVFVDKTTESAVEYDPRYQKEPPSYSECTIPLPEGPPPEADANLTEGFANLGLSDFQEPRESSGEREAQPIPGELPEVLEAVDDLEDEPSDTEDEGFQQVHDNESFVYEKLDAGNIRVLVIHPPQAKGEAVRCSLRQQPLTATSLPYEALSYTWGNRENMKHITLNQQAFLIGENAEAALRHLRLPRKDRVVWIDAICINQNDMEEKAQQLPIMAKIYNEASRVCVWLGEQTEGSVLALEQLKQTTQSFRSNIHLWKTQRSHGKLLLPFKDQMKYLQESGNRVTEFYAGEIRELLSRPWWGRAWIVQEVIAGRNPFIMLGDDILEWKEISKWKGRSRQETLGMNNVSPFGIDTPPKHDIFDQLYHVLSGFREQWAAKTWNMSVLALLYRFRHLRCSDKRDKIYAFLGLTAMAADTGFRPDYSLPIDAVYRSFAMTLIDHTGNLDVLNYKREWNPSLVCPPKPQVSAYSMLDQAKYHDTYADVVNPDGSKLRKAWARLPPDWERRNRDKQPYYYNWADGKEYTTSPLGHKSPSIAGHVETQKVCPPGWQKEWDNLGRHRVFYEHNGAKECIRVSTLAKFKLPSWVPNWARPTHLDPPPLLDLGGEEQIFLAGGNGKAEIMSRENPKVLSLRGFQFDRIARIADPWHPEEEYPPMSRKYIPVLAQWEELAIQEVPNCPYGGVEGRKNALWRTHLADPAHGKHAWPAQDRWLVECWYDRVGWAIKRPGHEELIGKGLLETARMDTEYSHISTTMTKHFLTLVQEEFQRKIDANELSEAELETKAVMKWFKSHDYKKYGTIATQIFKACSHRALYVTGKGHLGLAPWNAKKGDVITVFPGAKTPFLLREKTRSGRFSLVGETFVYGIMGGEVLDMNLPSQMFNLI